MQQQFNKKPLPTGFLLRQTALRLLGAVLQKKTSLDALVDNEHGHPQYLALSTADRLLVRAILGTCLRHKNCLLQFIESTLDHPLPPNAHSLQNILLIGASQLIYLNTPAHAAIFLTVELAKQDPRNKRFAKLANAVLRKIEKNKATFQSDASCQNQEPAWLITQLQNAYGIEKTNQIFYMQTLEPTRDFTIKEPLTQDWAKELNGFYLPNQSVRLYQPQIDITSLTGFEQGQWWIQDVSASLPVQLLGSIKNKKVADLCAAPGGKTLQLAQAGAQVTAVDSSKNRMRRLLQNFERLNLQVETVISDVQDFYPETLFDISLLDAPCSSTGTIRRHPDVLWTKDMHAVEKLAQLQYRLLQNVIRMVKPNGFILFCNCSLLPIEGEELIQKFLIEHQSEVELVPFDSATLPNAMQSLISPEGYLRTTPADLPHENPKLAGMDGFFAAKLQRK